MRTDAHELTVYRYSYCDEYGRQRISFSYATLEAIRDRVLGVPLPSESKVVAAQEINDGLWQPPSKVRGPTEIFSEYMVLQGDLLALTNDWIAAADDLRRLEVEALMDAARAASRVLFAEYQAACTSRLQRNEHG